MIGSSRLPCCFARLPNPSYPCGAQYFSNEKVWNGCSAALTNLYSACYFFQQKRLVGLHNYVALKHTPSLSRHQPVVAQVLLWKCFARLSFPFLFELKYVMGFRNTGFN